MKNDVATYLRRMKKSPQFDRIGIEPIWCPDTCDVDGFIHDEIVRQYHDSRVEDDGGCRVRWMKSAWQYARSLQPTFTMNELLHVAWLVEPHVNQYGFRDYPVWIGGREGLPEHRLAELGARLLTKNQQVMPVQGLTLSYPLPTDPDVLMEWMDEIRTADDWYLVYEWIHFWGDGNGRSGKALHNLLLDTLDNPVLVTDYFGMGNP